ncbi:MAG: hypothetical protein ACAH95_08400 [Fimbriimonas sp.]
MIAQVAILLFLLKMCNITGRDFWSARKMFSPIAFLAIAFSIQFLGAQVVLPLAGFPVLGFEGTELVTRIQATVQGQAILCAFLGAFVLGFAPLFSLLRRRDDRAEPYVPVTRITYGASWLWMIIGLGAAIMLGASWDGTGSRSQLVQGIGGQMGYAISFCATVAATVMLPSLYARRHYVMCFVVVLVIASVFLPLGGRSRLLLPILQSAMIITVAAGTQFKPRSLAFFGAGLLTLMAALDPLMAVLIAKKITFGQAVGEFFANLNIAYFFTSRNFDGFHNLSLLAFYDRISPDIGRITGGAGPDFMQEYFPEVAARGFGYPPTVPGEFYLIGSWVGVLIGAFFVGALFAFMQASYMRVRKVSTLVIYFAALPWVASLGYVYFDFLLKDIAAVLPAVMLWVVDLVRVRRATPVPVVSKLQPIETPRHALG